MSYQSEKIDHGVRRAVPLPSQQALKEYYVERYYQMLDGTTTYESTYTEKEIQHKKLEADVALYSLKDNITENKNSQSLIELGCGEGYFLKQVQAQTSWDIKGVDFSQFGVEKWNPDLLGVCEFGDIYDTLNVTIQSQQCYDICALRNVFEHVMDPSNLLSNIKKILNKTGLLLITVPNDYSVLQSRARELGHIDRDFWFSPPDHLHYFNTDNIIDYVKEQGFEVVDFYSSFPVDMYLYHPGSNYIADKTKGKSVHYARIEIDLQMAKSGVENVLNLYRAMVKCGVGRDMTVVLRQVA